MADLHPPFLLSRRLHFAAGGEFARVLRAGLEDEVVVEVEGEGGDVAGQAPQRATSLARLRVDGHLGDRGRDEGIRQEAARVRLSGRPSRRLTWFTA